MTSNERPTRLKHLMLWNYRCFPELDVTFHPALTVVVAPNGSGKTALLDAVAIALRLFVDTLQARPSSSGFHPDDVRLQIGPDSTMSPVLPTSIAASGSVGGIELRWTLARYSDRRHAKTKFDNATSLKDAATALREHLQDFNDSKRSDSPVFPIVAYYGTGRLFGAHRLTKTKIEGGTNRLRGYEDCLSSASRYKYFEDWFERFSRVAQQERADGKPSPHAPKEKLEAVTSAVNSLLAPSGWRNLSWDFAEDQIVATHPEHGTLPVDHLSDGIRNMIGMVGDIAHRCTRLNPHLGSQAARQTHGIVMIDEVDMHLHPEWQQVVIQSLQDAFPLLQFIVTTHSPQVLTTVKSENIRVLGRDAAGAWEALPPPQEIKGVESAVALNTVMRVNPIPPVDEAKWLTDYVAHVENSSHTSAEAVALREKLHQLYGPTHPVILDVDRLIRFQAFKLRKGTTPQS